MLVDGIFVKLILLLVTTCQAEALA